MEVWIGFAGLCVSIIGSAIGVGYKLGKIETRLVCIDKHLIAGAKRMDEHDRVLDKHGERLARLEGRIKSA